MYRVPPTQDFSRQLVLPTSSSGTTVNEMITSWMKGVNEAESESTSSNPSHQNLRFSTNTESPSNVHSHASHRNSDSGRAANLAPNPRNSNHPARQTPEDGFTAKASSFRPLERSYPYPVMNSSQPKVSHVLKPVSRASGDGKITRGQALSPEPHPSQEGHMSSPPHRSPSIISMRPTPRTPAQEWHPALPSQSHSLGQRRHQRLLTNWAIHKNLHEAGWI